MSDAEQQNLWQIMNSRFLHYWVNWAQRKEDWNGTGYERFNADLDERASATKKPGQYKAAFQKLLGEISLPTIATMQQYFAETDEKALIDHNLKIKLKTLLR